MRNHALGNAVVPIQAKYAFSVLAGLIPYTGPAAGCRKGSIKRKAAQRPRKPAAKRPRRTGGNKKAKSKASKKPKQAQRKRKGRKRKAAAQAESEPVPKRTNQYANSEPVPGARRSTRLATQCIQGTAQSSCLQ